MRTECHCLYCPKHPLHAQRSTIASPTSFGPGRFVMGAEETGRGVTCLNPVSEAFDAFGINPLDEEFPVTAYGGGASMTGFERDGITLYAGCADEKYVP